MRFKDVESLVTLGEHMPPTRFLAVRKAMDAFSTLFDGKVWCGSDLAAKTLLAIHANAHSIRNEAKQVLGLGLYTPASLMNHSCDPSCVFEFEGPVLVMRLIKDVQKNEELTYSYVDVYESREARHRTLREIYFISQCMCQRCDEPLERSRDRWIEGFVCGSCSKDPLATEEVLEPFLLIKKADSEDLECGTCNLTVTKEEIQECIRQQSAIFRITLEQLRSGRETAALDLIKETVFGPSEQIKTEKFRPHPFNESRFNMMLQLTHCPMRAPTDPKDDTLNELNTRLNYSRKLIEALAHCKFQNHPEMVSQLRVTAQMLKLKLNAIRLYLDNKQLTDVDQSTKHDLTSELSNIRNELIDILKRQLASAKIVYGENHPSTRQLVTDLAKAEHANR